MKKQITSLLYVSLLILQGTTHYAKARGVEHNEEEKGFFDSVLEGVKNNKEKVAAAAVITAGIGAAVLHAGSQNSTTELSAPAADLQSSTKKNNSSLQSLLRAYGFPAGTFADKAIVRHYSYLVEVEKQGYLLEVSPQGLNFLQFGDQECKHVFQIRWENNIFKAALGLERQCTNLPQTIANVVINALRKDYGELVTTGIINTDKTVTFNNKHTNQKVILHLHNWTVTNSNYYKLGRITSKQTGINNGVPVFGLAWENLDRSQE